MNSLYLNSTNNETQLNKEKQKIKEIFETTNNQIPPNFIYNTKNHIITSIKDASAENESFIFKKLIYQELVKKNGAIPIFAWKFDYN